ncbi:hypothetical protein ABEF95_016197 [Exophiala dermatitidis]
MGSVYGGRYDDSRTSLSSRRDGGYTTVKRYVVKEEDARSTSGRDRRFVPDRAGERVEETRIVRRERDVDEPPRREDPRYSERELVIRRERDEEPRRDYAYDSWREEPVAERELVIRRTTERDEPPPQRYDDRTRDVRISETRYRDDYEVVPPPRPYEDRDLQRYTRTAEYFVPPPPPPATIIIRQEPIIIREKVRDDDYQIVRKSDIDEERSVVRRGPPTPRGEEDFFYEKKVRERIDERRDDDDDYYERRSRRRSVSPHDSVSQRGRDYSSDDSIVYVRKETREEASPSPDRRKSLAAGVVAGVGAAELLRNHKKKEGRETSHGIGRVGRDIGAGALGALAAEGIHRARSLHRSKSRHRSRDRSRDRYSSRSRSRSRRRSRSRSESPSKLKTLGAVGLGAAALAAAATIASKRLNKGAEEPRRSRSRHRRESISSLEDDPSAPSDDARNPKHRNKRIAEAGAAGAVVAGLIERARSKSRARDGKERSRSRVRQALPVVAAGLGSAALAGLYEKNKARKEAKQIAEEQRRARSRSRSRARSDGYYDGPRDAALSDPGLIEYGNGPMYGNNFGPDYYGRPPPAEGYYGASNAVVPAAAGAAAGYGAQRAARSRSRSRSLSRDRGGRRSSRSSSSSPDRSKHGSRRRSSRDAANMAAAAGPGAIAASEYERRKQEKRERKARRRREEEGYARDPYEDNYNPAQPYPPTPPPPANDPYASQQGFYPQTSQFPPPPGSVPQQYPPQQSTPSAGPPPAASYPAQSFPPPPPPGGPLPSTTPYDAYGSGANPYAPRGPENVSAEPLPPHGNSSVPATSNDLNHVDGLGAAGVDPSAPSANDHSPSTLNPATNPPPLSNSPSRGEHVSSSARGLSPQRSQSQPAPSSRRKSVQFADKPEISITNDSAPEDSEASIPERHRHRHRHDDFRGYESEDDTDTTPVEDRRGDRRRSSEPEAKRRDHRRRQSHEPSSSRSGLRAPPLERVTSPSDSDATVELPPRFDEHGRRKPDPSDDPLADRLDEILAGRGVAGKMFGNFLDGLLGSDGRKKKSSR